MWQSNGAHARYLLELVMTLYLYPCVHNLVWVAVYVTGLGKNDLIAGLVKTDFFPEKTSNKFQYCLCKI